MTTLYLDNSTLRAMAACSTLAVTRYGLGYTTVEERAPIKAGLAMHEAVAAFFTSRGDEALARETLDTAYRAWAEETLPPQDRLGWDNVRDTLAAWLTAHPLSSFPFVVPPSMVEVGAQATLTDDGVCLCGHTDAHHYQLAAGANAPATRPCHGADCSCPDATTVVYCGRLDAVGRSRDDRWFAVDVKTTGRMDRLWLDQFHTDSQMNGYVWLLTKHMSEPVAGAIIIAIEIAKLPGDPVRRCVKHGTTYAECRFHHARSEIVLTERSPAQIVEWRKGALSLARRYRDLLRIAPTLDDVATKVRMTGAFHGHCPRCELRAWCRGGRDVAMAEVLFVHEPWTPYVRTTTPSEVPR